MAGFKCPFCNQVMPITEGTSTSRTVAFSESWNGYRTVPDDSALDISFYKCPNCGQFSIFTKGTGDAVQDVNMPLRPISSAIQFPVYIPEHIRQDYQEACAIANLSPKASATLSRRCLQAMIRDFWEIKESTLFKEIEALDKVIPPTQKKVLHSLRQIGNIGAHPEADVNTIIDIDTQDASKLIKVIEFFMDKWYIDRHEQEQLFNEINELNEDLQSQRNQKE